MKAEAAETERQGLCDPANLDIFTTWYAFGGTQRGISPMEAAEMPASLRRDFLYILSELTKEREKREDKKKHD